MSFSYLSRVERNRDFSNPRPDVSLVVVVRGSLAASSHRNLFYVRPQSNQGQGKGAAGKDNLRQSLISQDLETDSEIK